eukprot:jgi/Botrbrau1/16488/Bobra.0142s0082.1
MGNPRSRGNQRKEKSQGVKKSNWSLSFIVALVAFCLVGLYKLANFILESPDLVTVSGPAYVVDGDSLLVDEEVVRLLWIDAPELDQKCLDWKGSSYSCGVAAKAALAKYIGWAWVTCEGTEYDKYGRLLGHCTRLNWLNKPVDLGQQLLRRGHAVLPEGHWRSMAGKHRVAEMGSKRFARLSEQYDKAVQYARGRRLGVWGGSFDNPSAWRHKSSSCVLCGTAPEGRAAPQPSEPSRRRRMK